MTRKKDKETTEESFDVEDGFSEEEETNATDISFDVEDEYKPTPLVPNGGYAGALTEIKYNGKSASIDFSVTLNDNGGVMSDGETPLDGSTHIYKVWLPRPGDDVIMTKSGKQTKRQYKINAMKEFSKGLSIDMNSMDAIMEALENQEWLGMDVKVVLTIDKYKGRVYNKVEELAL